MEVESEWLKIKLVGNVLAASLRKSEHRRKNWHAGR
jgi:hypothetical protein